MNRYIVLLLLTSACSIFAENLPPPATQEYQGVPLKYLLSSTPPKDCIWVRAFIVYQMDRDTYLIRDKTGEMILFLPTDNLSSLTLEASSEVYIYGTIDLSPVNPQKNEFYAEKILRIPSE